MNNTIEMREAVASPPRREGDTRRWWALAALVLSALVIGLDMTILVTALPTLSVKLSASTSELQWLSDAYTLALGGLLLPAGVLGDHYGRRRLLLIGLVLFGISSSIASEMTSAAGLIWMRAIMGVGAAIILPITLSILPSLFTPKERPRAVALAAAGAFLGLPLGPLAAGWLLTHFAWGSVFLVNAPVVVLAFVGVWFLVPESKDPQAPRLDRVGAVLAVTGVTALVYGIIEEPGRGWTDAPVLVSLLGGAVLVGTFILWDLRTTSPLVDLHIFLNRRFTWATVAFTVAGFALTGVLFVLTPYLQIVQGNDAQGTGIRLLPMIAAIMVSGVASDRLTARFGTKGMVAGGLMVTGAGLVLLSRAGVETGYGLVAVSLTIAGLGLGLAMPPALDAVLGALPPAQAGAATGLSRTLQQIGASFGVAILGSVLNAAYRGGVSGHLAGVPVRLRVAVESSVTGVATAAPYLPGPVTRALSHYAHDAYAQGMAEVLLLCAGLMAVGGLLVALFLPAQGATAEVGEAVRGEVAPAAAVRS